MGCCNASIVESDFQTSPAGSMIIQDRASGVSKRLPISIPLINEGSPSLPPKLTPYFGKKFQFEESEKVNYEKKSLDIN